MKIAIIADALDYQYAGIYYYTKELINALAKVDTKNEYLIVRSTSEGDISKNVKELVIPIKKIPGAAAYRLFVSIPKILTQKKVDIVLEPRHFGPFNLPKNIKRVTVIHDLSPIHFPAWHQFISRKLQQLFLPSILKKADFVIANSNFTANDVVRHFPFTINKIKGILLGKEDFFQPNSDRSILQKYNIKVPYLLHTGTIEPRKNLIFLTRAFEGLKRQINHKLELVLVGKLGWKHNTILKAINDSPFKQDIKLLGYVDRTDLPTLYTSATAFVYPSHFEGFGLPVLEAMSCGTPPIVSNISSLPEIMDDAGLLFPPNHQIAFIQQIRQILEDKSLRKDLSNKALKRATEFSWEKTAKETLGIFEALINKKV